MNKDLEGSLVHKSPDNASASRKSGPTLEVTFMLMSGETLGSVTLPVSWTVRELKAHLCQVEIANKGAGPNAFSLLYGDSILKDATVVDEILPSPNPSMYLVQQKKRVNTAKDIAGAHTGNPQYFKRENEGTEDEALVLLNVCWFSVGTTFRSIPAGTYNVVVEAAKDSSGWTPFEMQVKPTKERWAPGAQLTEEFQEFRVAELILDEPTEEVGINLFNTDGPWRRGLKIRSITLE